MADSYYEIEEKAQSWLRDRAPGQLVHKKSAIDPIIYRYLKTNGFLADVYASYFFIKKDSLTTDEAFKQNYWTIVGQLLDQRFGTQAAKLGWYLSGRYAYEFLVDSVSVPQADEQITIQTKGASNTTLTLLGKYPLVAVQDRQFHKKKIVSRTNHDSPIYLLKPELLLVYSTKTHYLKYEKQFVSYIQSKDFDFNFVEEHFKKNPSQTLLARFIGALQQADKKIQALKLKELYKNFGYTATIENTFNSDYALKGRAVPSYVSRFRLSMQDAQNYLEAMAIPEQSGPVTAQEIEVVSVSETYHSLTIEGYDVTKEIIQKIQQQDIVEGDLRSKLAAKGFLSALAFCKLLVGSSYNFNQELSEELWKKLWAPSIHASDDDLAIYRNHFVFLQGSRAVPPNHEKIHYLLEEFYSQANDFSNGFRQAIFLHYFYVTIHPHSDGNGRISRFLMNLALIGDNYSWLTIPIEKREAYFKSLERSQLEDDISHFASFINDQWRQP